MQYRPRSSSSTSSALSSMACSPSLHHAGWNPSQATVSPAVCTSTEPDSYAMKRSDSTDSNASSVAAGSSMRRDSTSSTTSSTSSTFSSSPFSDSIAYPCWPVNDNTIATSSRRGSSVSKAVIPPPVQMPTSYIGDDELASLDFTPSSRRNSGAEYDAGAQGISWSQTRQPTEPQREERRRRLPPPPPGMATVCSGKRKASKDRRRKGLSMIKE